MIERDVFNQISENLYLGDKRCYELQKHPCKAALSLASEDLKQPKFAESYKYLTISDFPDESKAKIKQVILEGVRFIEENMNRKVLVFCGCGVSRSASVVVAYIMKSQKMSFENALYYVQQKRQWAHPNSTIQEVLKKLVFE